MQGHFFLDPQLLFLESLDFRNIGCRPVHFILQLDIETAVLFLKGADMRRIHMLISLPEPSGLSARWGAAASCQTGCETAQGGDSPDATRAAQLSSNHNNLNSPNPLAMNCLSRRMRWYRDGTTQTKVTERFA